jgi:hypothetical protein
MSFLLSLIFSLQQNWRTRRREEGEVAQTMYTYVSKCKNDKIKEIKKRLKIQCHVICALG